MNRRASFGIVFSSRKKALKHIFKLERILESNYGHAYLINNYDRRSGLDILILPHHVGIDPNATGFMRGDSIRPVSTVKTCNRFSRFMFATFEYYIELRYPIIGVGDGAANLWNYLGQKIDVINGRLQCVPPTNSKLTSLDFKTNDIGLVTQFKDGNIIGFTDPFDTNLYPTIRALLKRIEEDEEPEFGI